jgi:adenylosuccinate synthase
MSEKSNPNGSCGVGFGSTIQRQEDYYKLFVQDLFFENVLEQKLNNIRNYYSKKFNIEPNLLDTALNIDINDFLYVINKIKDIIKVSHGDALLDSHNLVFEGAQGILLDQDFGFFPNVTRSNTTSKNALEILAKKDIRTKTLARTNSPEIYYITRAYQTRHGNGYMSNEGLIGGVKLKNNEKETNVTNEYQGKFRTSILDLDLLNYSLTCDNNFSKGLNKNLVITCVDQTGEYIKVTSQGSIKKMNVEEVSKHLNVSFDNVYVSRGSSMSDITLVK